MKVSNPFIEYKIFLKNYALRKIVSYYPEEMDIARCQKVMNFSGDIFCVNDVILVYGKRYKIIAFGAYDNDWFGAIVVGRKNGIAKYVRLEEAINITEMKKYKGTVKEVLIKNGFKPVDNNTFVDRKITVEINESDSFDIYFDCSNMEDIEVVADGVNPLYLERFLEALDTMGIREKYYDYLTLDERSVLQSAYL